MSIKLFFLMLFLPGMVDLSCTMSTAEAGTLISERMKWSAQEYVDFGAGCQSYPYSFTGPGYLRVRHTMTPDLRRRYFNKADPICAYDSEGWTSIRSEFLYDGKPLLNGGGAGDGIFKVYTMVVEYEIPTRAFSGTFSLCSPLNCGLASCYQRAGEATLEVEFSTTPFSGASPTESSGEVSSGTGQAEGGNGQIGTGSSGSSGGTAGGNVDGSKASSSGKQAGGVLPGGSNTGGSLPSGTVANCPQPLPQACLNLRIRSKYNLLTAVHFLVPKNLFWT